MCRRRSASLGRRAPVAVPTSDAVRRIGAAGRRLDAQPAKADAVVGARPTAAGVPARVIGRTGGVADPHRRSTGATALALDRRRGRDGLGAPRSRRG